MGNSYAERARSMASPPAPKYFPKLYALDSQKRVRCWDIEVVTVIPLILPPYAVIQTTYGIMDKGMQVSRQRVSVGKNLGRANETDAMTQAIAEAQSKWKKQIDKGYTAFVDTDDVEAFLEKDPKSIHRPMLAHSYDKQSHRIQWPAYTQPKLDGIRMIASIQETSVVFHSRNGKPIKTVDHLIPELLATFDPGTTIDGELFNPMMTLQEIVSGAKKQSALSVILEYWIYDIVDFEKGFAVRQDDLLQMKCSLPGGAKCLKRVPTEIVKSVDDMKDNHKKYILGGFEGTIIRNAYGKYVSRRSADLQKYKDFKDEEFEIIGYKEGKGKDEGTVIFKCVTGPDAPKGAGLEFDCRPRGTHAQRSAWFDDIHGIIGKMLTVRFVNWTPDGKPFHLTGLAIRDYE